MLDHITIPVTDYAVSKDFYAQALGPLGASLLEEDEDGAGFGVDVASFWIRPGAVTEPGHIAFTSPDRPTVDAFYDAAIAAGGTDNGAPGVREEYHPNYYGAFVLDPDGYNIEAVIQEPVD